MYKDFTEMPVWQQANSLVQNIYIITVNLPKSEDYALTSQLRRAALSVTGNIAEGFGRGHTKDKANFYLYARGSAFEVKSYLFTGVTVNYFDQKDVDNIIANINLIIESLNKLIKTLRSQP